MLRLALILARKDLRLLLFRNGGLAQALLLGLLLIFIFSLSAAPGEKASPESAAAVFWLGSIFCQILIFTRIYALEEEAASRDGLLLLPFPVQGVWLGKALAGAILLLLSQALFLPSAIIFLNIQLQPPLWPGLASLLITDAGVCALGSILGAVSAGAGGRESLLSILFFPLLTPILLCGISLMAETFGGGADEAAQWILIGLSFDLLFIGAGLLLFGFIYQEGD